MAKFKKLTQVTEGKITYFDGIIDGIVLLTVNEIPYVKLCSKENNSLASNSSIFVSVERDEIHVDVDVKVHHTQSISEIAFKIQEAIRHNIEAMTEYHVASVNVNILGVLFDEPTTTITEETSNNVEDTKEVTHEN